MALRMHTQAIVKEASGGVCRGYWLGETRLQKEHESLNWNTCSARGRILNGRDSETVLQSDWRRAVSAQMYPWSMPYYTQHEHLANSPQIRVILAGFWALASPSPNNHPHVFGLSGTIAVKPRFESRSLVVDHPGFEKCKRVVIFSGYLVLRNSCAFHCITLVYPVILSRLYQSFSRRHFMRHRSLGRT